jgi:hypothetical protein
VRLFGQVRKPHSRKCGALRRAGTPPLASAFSFNSVLLLFESSQVPDDHPQAER